MTTFFVLLVLAMVLVVAVGAWMNGPRRRVYYVERDPDVVVERDRDVVEEVVNEPVRTRVVRRRRTY